MSVKGSTFPVHIEEFGTNPARAEILPFAIVENSKVSCPQKSIKTNGY
jgi:hypothetical protein